MESMRPNFYKRYKWAFRPDYGQIYTPPIGHPDYEGFLEFCEGVIEEQERSDGEEGLMEVDPRGLLEGAKIVLDGMMKKRMVSPWVKARWGEEMIKVGITEFVSFVESPAH